MAPVLYYAIYSPPARCALMTAREIGLEVNLKSIDLFKGEHLTEDYKKINPQHTVPTLVDGDFIVWDSHAVATYMISKFAKTDKLYPKDLQKRATVDQRLHFDSSVLFPLAANIVQSIRHGASEIIPAFIERLNNACDFLELFLDGNKFMCGKTMTVADISIISTLSSINAITPIDLSKHPKLKEYFKEMAKLPYYDEINVKGIEPAVSALKKEMESNKSRV